MDPCTLLITYDEDRRNRYNVWITLPDHDPLRDAFGFVVGVGNTRDNAGAKAVAVLEDAVARLQAPAGAIEE